MREDLDMTKFGSVMALGFLLALPLSASAGTPADSKDEQQVTAVASNDVAARPADTATDKAEKQPKRSENRKLRGATHGDPGVRFNNPYAFPIQSLPIGLPNVTSFSF
jgi:hypothetical protein